MTAQLELRRKYCRITAICQDWQNVLLSCDFRQWPHFFLSEPTVNQWMEQSDLQRQTPRSAFKGGGRQTRSCLICLQVGSYLRRAKLVKCDTGSQHFASTQKVVQSATYIYSPFRRGYSKQGEIVCCSLSPDWLLSHRVKQMPHVD